MQTARAGSPTFREEPPKNAVVLVFQRHIDYSRPSSFGFCLISLNFFHVVNFSSMNTTIMSDLFLLGFSVNDKSPIHASFLMISNSVSKISPSLMKER